MIVVPFSIPAIVANIVLFAGVPQRDRSGWGLFLVERLADRWGVAEEHAATKVWFELRRA